MSLNNAPGTVNCYSFCYFVLLNFRVEYCVLLILKSKYCILLNPICTLNNFYWTHSFPFSMPHKMFDTRNDMLFARQTNSLVSGGLITLNSPSKVTFFFSIMHSLIYPKQVELTYMWKKILTYFIMKIGLSILITRTVKSHI